MNLIQRLLHIFNVRQTAHADDNLDRVASNVGEILCVADQIVF